MDDNFVPSENGYIFSDEIHLLENFVKRKDSSTLHVVYDYTENFVIEDDRDGLKILKPKVVDFLLAVYFNEDKPIGENSKDHKKF